MSQPATPPKTAPGTVPAIPLTGPPTMPTPPPYQAPAPAPTAKAADLVTKLFLLFMSKLVLHFGQVTFAISLRVELSNCLTVKRLPRRSQTSRNGLFSRKRVWICGDELRRLPTLRLGKLSIVGITFENHVLGQVIFLCRMHQSSTNPSVDYNGRYAADQRNAHGNRFRRHLGCNFCQELWHQ